MPSPRMVIVAGPSGGGKSSLFPIFQMQIDAFSTDLRAATLLGEALGRSGPVSQPPAKETGRYMQFRKQAGAELERFIQEHIDAKRSFAFETTLREVTFDQIRKARQKGFRVEMIFVAGGDEGEHRERVAERGVRGGHVASAGVLRDIYRRSMGMLRRAFDESQMQNIDVLAVFDNPRVPVGELPRPRLLVEVVGGVTARQSGEGFPGWFERAMGRTEFPAGGRIRARFDEEQR